MKRFIALVLALVISAFTFAPKVSAYEVLSVSATAADGSAIVTGTTEDEMLAVAISVYKASDSSLVTVETTGVTSGAFSYVLYLDDGDYIISVADYDGGVAVTKNVTISTPAADTEDTDSATAGSPDTGMVAGATEKAEVAEIVTSEKGSATTAMLAVVAAGVAGIALVFGRKMLKREK